VKTYSVQTLPWSAASDSEAVLIAEGFNWFALIFGPFWALWHGMWRTAIVLVVIGAALGGLGALIGVMPDVVSVFEVLVQIGLGLWGNDLRRAALSRQRGYVERAVVCGRNQAEAEQRYFTTVAPGAA
jgi:hypothetical protein